MRIIQDESDQFIGVLLLYYDKYAEKALQEFVELMDLVSDRNKIIVVINNPLIKEQVIMLLKLINVERQNPVKFVIGDNSIREFSGWQSALDLYVNSIYSAIVFANDTFVHHRTFNWWSKKSYSRCIQRLGLESKPNACGSLTSSDKLLTLEHVEINRWISTSIFAINRSAIEKLENRIHPEYQQLLDWIPGVAREESFFSPQLDKPMKEHLVRWLFQANGINLSWYGAASLTKYNAESMKAKAMCILSEKWLAMRMIMTGVKMSDPVANYPNRFFYAILRRIFKL
jgi:hypothetical protein